MTAKPGRLLVVERRDDVVHFILNRPRRRNALDGHLLQELERRIVAASGDHAVRAIVLGAAPPVFCAGIDLDWLRGLTARGEADLAADLLGRLARAMETSPVPIVALVDGPAVGAGVELVCAADVVVATDRATFALPEARAGMIPAGVLPSLRARIGPGWAAFMAMTAAPVEVEDAHLMGLVHRPTICDRAESEVAAVVEYLVRSPRETLAAIKQGWGVGARPCP